MNLLFYLLADLQRCTENTYFMRQDAPTCPGGVCECPVTVVTVTPSPTATATPCPTPDAICPAHLEAAKRLYETCSHDLSNAKDAIKRRDATILRLKK